jgi:type I restriction-modification system DNA methylase subunit
MTAKTRNTIDFQTPAWVCNYMAGLVPLSAQTILEPTPGKGNLVNSLEKLKYQVTAPDDFWQLPSGKWDYVVMNPPFTPMPLGYKILYACMEKTDRVIALMPWLTLINSERRTKALKDYGLRQVAHLPRSVFKGSRVQCCIIDLERGYTGITELHWLAQPA